MYKRLFVIFVSLFIAGFLFAADKAGKTDKYDDPGLTTLFEKIIEFENETADSLYDKCLIWYKKNFKFQNECYIDYADKQSHTIRATYVDIVRYT